MEHNSNLCNCFTSSSRAGGHQSPSQSAQPGHWCFFKSTSRWHRSAARVENCWPGPLTHAWIQMPQKKLYLILNLPMPEVATKPVCKTIGRLWNFLWGPLTPAASAPPRSLCNMQTLEPLRRPTDSEIYSVERSQVIRIPVEVWEALLKLLNPN